MTSHEPIYDPLFTDTAALIKEWESIAKKIDEQGNGTITARVRSETFKTCALQLGAALYRSHRS